MKHIILIGFLGRDPEEKVTKTGNKAYFFPLAVDGFSGGEKKTMWYQIQVWEPHLFNMAKVLHKGSLLALGGTPVEPEIYESKEGEKKVKQAVKATSLWFVPGRKEEKPDEDNLF